jgi:phospholipase C
MAAIRANTTKSGFTFAQYGVRVPAVIVSPLLPRSVDHTIYDHASVLATMEWLFGIPPLTQRDAKARVIKGIVPLPLPRRWNHERIVPRGWTFPYRNLKQSLSRPNKAPHSSWSQYRTGARSWPFSACS